MIGRREFFGSLLGGAVLSKLPKELPKPIKPLVVPTEDSQEIWQMWQSQQNASVYGVVVRDVKSGEWVWVEKYNVFDRYGRTLGSK